MDTMGTEPVASLHDYITVVRRRARLVIVVLVAGLVVSLVAASMIGGRRTRYEATAEILLVPSTPLRDGGGARADIQLNTERALVKSSIVADRAARTLHRHDARRLAKGLEVSLREDTQVLEVKATSSDPRRAEAVASAFASAYLDVRGSQLSSQRAARISDIETRITGAEDDLRRATADLAAATPDGATSSSAGDVAARADAQARQQLAVASITTFNQQLADATATDVDPGRIVSQPDAERVSRTATTPVVGLLGLLLSAVAAVAAALVWDRIDWRIRNGNDLEAFSGVPTLGEIPRHGRTPLVVAAEPSGPSADAYRRLRSNLRFVVGGRPGAQVVLVTSAGEGEGKTVVTTNLAMLLARAGLRVTVVSGDLRRPRLDALLGIDAVDGLSAALAGLVDVHDVTRTVDGMTIVPAGEPAGEPADLLQSTRTAEVFDALRADADLVLVDSPPALVVADALAMAPYADGVVAVADARATGRDDAVALRQELDRAGGHLLGFVLTKVRPRRRVSSYYYGGASHSDQRRTERAAAVPLPPAPEQEPRPEQELVPEPAVEPVHREEPRPSSNGAPPPVEWGFGDWVAATMPGDG